MHTICNTKPTLFLFFPIEGKVKAKDVIKVNQIPDRTYFKEEALVSDRPQNIITTDMNTVHKKEHYTKTIICCFRITYKYC